MKKRTLLLIGLLFLFACVVTNWAAPAKKTSRITLSKATTRVTGPLTKDGYVDYPRVINQRLSVGITAENNANVLLWRAMGPQQHQNSPTTPPTPFIFLNLFCSTNRITASTPVLLSKLCERLLESKLRECRAARPLTSFPLVHTRTAPRRRRRCPRRRRYHRGHT